MPEDYNHFSNKKAMCELRSLFNMALSKIRQLMITGQIQLISFPEKYITFHEYFDTMVYVCQKFPKSYYRALIINSMFN